MTKDAVVFADPARRDAAGRRRWRPTDFAPPLDDLATACAGRNLVVKCAPGIDADALGWAAETELISLDGQVREACLYSAGLAGPQRRATVLSSGAGAQTITSDEPDDAGSGQPGEWLIDPDGAIVRAGLVRHYGARNGLWQLDSRIAYLTGDDPPPGIRAFRVFDYGSYTEKSLRQNLRGRGIGTVEILVRGLDIDPNTLRRRLKLRGGASATVVLTRIGRSPVAFLCTPERIPATYGRQDGAILPLW